MLREGERIGDVELEFLVAEGGQGKLWRGSRAGEKVALKVVPKGPRTNAEWKQLSQLDHISIVRAMALIEVDADNDGIILAWVEGRTLGEASRDPRWTPDHAAHAVRHLLGALSYVHAMGVVHRDVKPANVLIAEAFFSEPTQPANVVLVDFGIAAQFDNPTPLTRAGHRVGTVAYSAPESFLDWSARVEPSRDVFAIGVVAWELLAGCHPLGRPPADVDDWVWYTAEYRAAREHRRSFPEGTIAGELAELVRSCLELDAGDRPHDASAVLDPARRRLRHSDDPERPLPGDPTQDLPPVEPTYAPTSAALTPIASKHRTTRAPSPRLQAAALVGALAVVASGAAWLLGWRNQPAAVPVSDACSGVAGIPVDPPSRGPNMTLRSVPNDRDPAVAKMELQRGTIVKLLDRDAKIMQMEDWFRVRVECAPGLPLAKGQEGYMHGIGLPSLLPEWRVVRPTKLRLGSREATLSAGTRVATLTVMSGGAAPGQGARVRVLDGPEADNAGYVAASDIEKR